MPEGPEVRLNADLINRECSGKTLEKIEILGGRYRERVFKGYHLLETRLPMVLREVKTKGKYLFFDFGDIVLTSHLGMGGMWLTNDLIKKDSMISRHRHLVLEFTGIKLFFIDLRHFGILQVVEKGELKEIMDKIGPDMKIGRASCRERVYTSV
jgi:formamidopyrimidine-DNA glycosylase